MVWSELDAFERYREEYFTLYADEDVVEDCAISRAKSGDEFDSIAAVLTNATFADCEGDVIEGMRTHSQTLRWATKDAADTQADVSARIMKYHDILVAHREDLRRQAVDAQQLHSEYNHAVREYWRVYEALQAAVSIGNVATITMLEDQLATADHRCSEAKNNWDERLAAAQVSDKLYRGDVGKLAHKIWHIALPHRPIAYRGQQFTQLPFALSVPDIQYCADVLANAASEIDYTSARLVLLEGYDSKYGAWVARALVLINEQWQRYHDSVVAALAMFAQNTRQFSHDVRTVDDATRFVFDKVEHQFVDPATYYRLVSTIGTEANAIDPPGILPPLPTPPQAINEGTGGMFHSLRYLNHLTEADKKMISRVGGPMSAIPGIAVEYDAAREEGYSHDTALKAAIASNAASSFGGAFGGGAGSLFGPVGSVSLYMFGSYYGGYLAGDVVKRASDELVPPYRTNVDALEL